MTRLLAIVLLLTAACGGGTPDTAPDPQATLRATPEQLDSLWLAAEARLAEEEWNDAAVIYQRLMLELPRGDRRLAASRLALGEARMGQKSYLQAVREFRRTADEHPTDSLAAVGLLRAGDGYAKLWRRPELDPTYGAQAIATWQELLTRYPESPEATAGRDRIRGLEEWYAVKSYKAAEFYLKYKAYDSAILYLKDLVARYPGASVVPEALGKLVGAYRELGYVEDIEEVCGYFRSTHPEAAQLAEACPAATVVAPVADSAAP
jgi:outer membrane protein assembly factor BamD